jgi:hypothetical protein
MNAEQQQRLDEMEHIIRRTNSALKRRDLQKLYSNCQNLATALSRESVECRRLKIQTSRYKILEQELETALKNLEQTVTFGLLLPD